MNLALGFWRIDNDGFSIHLKPSDDRLKTLDFSENIMSQEQQEYMEFTNLFTVFI